MRAGTAVVLPLFLVTGLLPAAAATHTASKAPLTNEDVVRMVMTKTPEKDVLAAIDSRPVDFDLAPEMLAELREAGVGDVVIAAMQRRQAAMPRPEATPEASAASAVTGTLRLEFQPDDPKADPSSQSAIALKTLPKGISARPGMEVGLMTDMALAVLCTSADHVPDHWDSLSQIEGAPRHERLAFWPGSATTKVKGHEVLYLRHQPSYDIAVPEGDHNIVVVAAGRQAGPGTWRLLESDGARVTILPGTTTRVTIEAKSRIGGSAMTGFSVDSEWKIVGVQVLEEATGGPPKESGTPP